MILRGLMMVAIALSLSGCALLGELLASERDWVVPTVRPGAEYDEFFPYYAELCAVSQYRPLQGRPGGSPGHAVMYFKGACRDESAPYPRLRRCRHVATDANDPEHGAGISVNKWFKNVNWVATPGRRLFYDGDLDRWQVLDQAHRDATARAAIERGLFRGVDFHPPPDGEPPPSREEFIATQSLGTDFALRFGRAVFCARVPLREAMLERAMRFLNDLNAEYAEGEADYEWSGYSDNCVHTIHNALAAAGVWKPKSVGAIKVRQFFNMAVPANAFVDLAQLITFPIEEFDVIWGRELRRKGLLEDDWLPAQPGALVKTLSVHQENELYDRKYRMFLLEGFFGGRNRRKALEVLNDARLRELDSNLRYFRDRYDAILSEREDEDWIDSVRGARYQEGRERYYAYVEARRAEVKQRLETLRDRERGR